MIPVRDVIPTRTAPGVTVTLMAAMAAACAWPAVRDWWLPWASHAVVLWLAGGTLEDRFGHARFSAFVLACGAASMAAPLSAGLAIDPVWAVAGATAGVIAAYLVMFPRSRVLTLVPVVVGIEVADVPAWAVFACWAVLQAAAAWSVLTWSPPLDAGGAAVGAAAGAAAGALGGLRLPRPDRMRVDWWDPPASRS
jgi:membrane associated rhomboid family serine protease